MEHDQKYLIIFFNKMCQFFDLANKSCPTLVHFSLYKGSIYVIESFTEICSVCDNHKY